MLRTADVGAGGVRAEVVVMDVVGILVMPRGRGGLVIDGGHVGDAADYAHEALGGDEDVGALEAGVCGAEELSEDCDNIVEIEDEVS